MRKAGRRLRDLVDKPGERHYEIISFDPRGVSNSWPVANSFPNIINRNVYDFESHGNGDIERGQAALAYGLALTAAFGHQCEAVDHRENIGANANIMSYMGTASVARDMVAMVDEVHKLRKEILQHHDSSHSGHEKQSLLNLHPAESAKNIQLDLPRLQYIGFSYGTILGNSFASMFPRRVGRLVLDGVSNADDYVRGPVSLPRYGSISETLATRQPC